MVLVRTIFLSAPRSGTGRYLPPACRSRLGRLARRYFYPFGRLARTVDHDGCRGDFGGQRKTMFDRLRRGRMVVDNVAVPALPPPVHTLGHVEQPSHAGQAS